MFTGIIEHRGTVLALELTGDSAYLILDAGHLTHDLPPGGSLAVNGVCLTSVPRPVGERVGSAPANTFCALLMGETLQRSSLGSLRPGDPVNLERCMPAHGRFDGHIVQGHVDGVGTVTALYDHGPWLSMRVSIPSSLAAYTVEKGSIALAGTSLTLTAVSPPEATEHWVEVGLIPTTVERTVFGSISVGDPVNIEVDVLAKYAERRSALSRVTQREALA